MVENNFFALSRTVKTSTSSGKSMDLEILGMYHSFLTALRQVISVFALFKKKKKKVA